MRVGRWHLRWSALIGCVLVGLLLLTIVIGLFWLPYNPIAIDLDNTLAHPSARHWLGSDEYGRDELSRAMLGARISVFIAAEATAFVILLGSTVGVLTGFLRGWFDRVVMMVNDALLALPGILMALGIIAVLGPGEHHPGADVGLSAAGGARGAQCSDVCARARVYGCFHGCGRRSFVHHVSACAAKCSPTDSHPGNECIRLGGAIRECAQLSWGWRSSASSELGQHVVLVAALCGERKLPQHRSGTLHRRDVARRQPVWRCDARLVRSKEGLMSDPIRLLEVNRLRIATTPHHESPRVLLEDLSFDVASKEFLAIVGESGSGKTLASRAIMNLLPPGVARVSGQILLDGRELTALNPTELRKVRGAQVGMVFQEPMVSLNPAMTVGRQLAEGLKLHRNLPAEEIRALSLAMLKRVQIRDEVVPA